MDYFISCLKNDSAHEMVYYQVNKTYSMRKTCIVIEPRHEKTGFLHMRKQRHRPAEW